MCCSFDIGKPSNVQFWQYFVFENGVFRNIQKFPENATEEQGYHMWYPVCKFSGTILRQNQQFTTGGSPDITGFEAVFDILLIDEKTSERYNLQNVKKQYRFYDERNIPDDLIVYPWQEVYGILVDWFHFSGIELFQLYKNKTDFDIKTQAIPICKIKETPFLPAQKTENNMMIFSDNSTPTTNILENNYIWIGIFIFFLFISLYFLFKKFYRL